MKLKNLITIIILSMLNLVCGLLLTILVLPDKIPFLLDFNEQIINLCSKWVMLSASILPILFVITGLITKNNKLKFFMNMLFILV